MRRAQRLVVVGGIHRVGEAGGQAHLGQRGRDGLPIPRRLVVVEAVAKRGVQRAEHLRAVGLLGRDQHPDRTPAGLEQLAVLLRQVVLALVQHRQAHDVPGDRDRADLLHLADPAGGDPGPWADRVEPEVDVLRYLRGWLMRGHVQSQPPAFPVNSTRKGRLRVASNLTRDEAAERSALITVTSYQVDLDLTAQGGDETTFSSVTVIRFDCASPGSSSYIDLTAPAVREITLNGAPVSLDAFGGDRIALAGLAARNELRVAATCAYSRSGEGLHRFTDPADKQVYMYSDLETFDAHRIYACFDQPDMKATYQLQVTAPAGWQVVSNMAPDSHLPAGDAVRWVFPPTPVMSTYITAVAAGPYHVVRDDHDGIPLGIYCRQSLAEYLDADEIFEVTRQGFDFFHSSFGIKYPFGKYDQLFVPEFKEGAMENAGCVTFVEAYIFRSRVTDFAREARAETILHEMAHMWFGDLVTMRWWDDLWLNESFATWAGTLAQAEATRWSSAWTTFAQLYKGWAYRQDQLPSTHPIAADLPDIHAAEVNFDGITYAKGAAVLKQLVAYVGRDNFLAALRRYFDAHAWGNATLHDLLAALEETSGRDLSGWSKQWLETAGVNTLRPDYQTGPDGTITRFAVRQEAPASHPALRTHRIAVGLYDRTGSGPGSLVRRRQVEADVAGELTEVPELAGERRPDLVLVNDDDLTYAKVRLDDYSLRTLIDRIGDFADSLP